MGVTTSQIAVKAPWMSSTTRNNQSIGDLPYNRFTHQVYLMLKSLQGGSRDWKYRREQDRV